VVFIPTSGHINFLERFESVAQHLVRAAPIIFDKARGAELFDEKGNRYIDFWAAGGVLSHGHNDIKVCTALIDYICNDRIVQTCDKASLAKRRFVETFVTTILEPRKFDYRLLFTDAASGTAAEVALRLARRHKGRTGVIAFTNASHGLTEGSLTASSRRPGRWEHIEGKRNGVFMPFCGYFGEGTDTIAYLRRYLEDSASGVDHPAAIIVEPVQVHGGVHVASPAWLKNLELLCQQFGILLVVDESHTGCGRIGPYFGFERANIRPDMVIVPNSIAGGLPLSLLLMRSELDQWRPGEAVGIFQGDALSFVAASELLNHWSDERASETEQRGHIIGDELSKLCDSYPALRVRGTGMLWGLDFGRPAAAAVVSGWALECGLVIEPARIKDDVLLIQPPLTIDESVLREGLQRLSQVVAMFFART
jgi:diaminobutyrate-2-oxoglutarate transaminase